MNQTERIRRLPVFGVMSILFPVFGALLGAWMAHNAHGNGEGWAEFTVFTHYFGGAIAFGVISALFSYMRSEAHRYLSFIGLLLCIAPVLWFVIRML